MSDTLNQQLESSKPADQARKVSTFNPSKKKPVVPIKYWQTRLVGKKIVDEDAPDADNVRITIIEESRHLQTFKARDLPANREVHPGAHCMNIRGDR